MIKAWLGVALCTAAFGGSITYNYTGNPVYCSYGNCPANITSDYATAAVTLTTAIPANASGNFLTPALQQFLVGWTLGDAFSNITFSSTDANAANEITFLSLSGDNSHWNVDAGGLVNIQNPSSQVPAVGGGTYTVADHLQAANGSWQAVSPVPGSWTETLSGMQGGSTTSPVFLISATPISQVTNSISAGQGDYYSFAWGGGAFSASTSVTGAAVGDIFQFSLGLTGTCNALSSQNLNNIDSFSGTIALGNLAPGQYCIGIDEVSGTDPNFALNFNTPLNTVPEPSAFFLLSGGLGMIGVLRYARRGR